jgi:hypothetical protein
LITIRFFFTEPERVLPVAYFVMSDPEADSRPALNKP